MYYFDYSANYPCKKEVLEYLAKIEEENIGNANSIHEEGLKSYDLFKTIDTKIKALLNLEDDKEIIYTSSATESNNLAIKGIASSYSGFGKHILVSPYEHSSSNAALATLKDSGFEIEFLKLDKLGKIDLNDLKQKLRQDTILVVTIFVESEAGIVNDVLKISEIIKEINPNCHHLVDATQGITKIDIDLNKLDLVSFTPHKFGGLTGTGCLIKNKITILTPLINGGKSATLYRAGSIPLGLIGSIYKALELALENKEDEYDYVKGLWEYLTNNLKTIKKVKINSFDFPYIVNISLDGIKAKDSVELLNKRGICVSQKSACSISNTPSKTIMSVYQNRNLALSSFRISLADLTKKSDIDYLVNVIRSITDEKSIN